MKQQNLQEYNQAQRLAEWSEMITACRNSGMPVREWCTEHHVAYSTYYKRLKRVYAAAREMQESNSGEGQFYEVTAGEISESATAAPVVSLYLGDVRADVYTAADESTLRTVLKVLRSC